MDERQRIKPDKNFIKEVMGRGGDTLGKCFQCSTCTVMCPISPDDNPFPRKEMIWAQWGLKEKLLTDPDIWICQRCGDCSVNCPRDAKPGEVMAALREQVIANYAVPGFIGKAFSSVKYLPLLLFVPILFFVAYLQIWGDLYYPNNFHTDSEIVLDHFIKDWHGDIGMFIMFAFVFGVLGLGIRKFWKGMMSSVTETTRTGLTLLQSLMAAVFEIAKHANFTKCESSKKVYYAHLGILYGCVGLLAATGITALLHYAAGMHSPWGILSATKIFAIIGTTLVSAGLSLAIYRRLIDPDAGKSSFGDWFLLIMLSLAVLSGLATWLIRLSEWDTGTYWAYLIHLVFMFEFFIYLPFSKAAHIFYRLTATTWSYYTGRGL
jgi:quinone-modifying oxidoreductase subunit QmoC